MSTTSIKNGLPWFSMAGPLPLHELRPALLPIWILNSGPFSPVTQRRPHDFLVGITNSKRPVIIPQEDMAEKKKAKKGSAGTFEEAMGELEAMVEAMENDQLPLEELVAHYEKGAGLLRHCEKVLTAAKERIELIEVGNSAEKDLAPDPEEEEDSPGPGDSPAAELPEDDIRLL